MIKLFKRWLAKLIGLYAAPPVPEPPVMLARKPRFNPIDYDTWRRLERARLALEEHECPDCDGSGYSECSECGHEHECDCEGKPVGFEELHYMTVSRMLSRRAYHEAMKVDATAFAAWTGQDLDTMFNEWIKRSEE